MLRHYFAALRESVRPDNFFLMKIIDDYNACELVRAALSPLAKDGENQKNPSLPKLLSQLRGVLDEVQPKIISVHGLPGFILTTNIDPWLEAPMDRAFGIRASATGWTCQIQPGDASSYDLDLSDAEPGYSDD